MLYGLGLVGSCLLGMFVMAVIISVRKYELCPRCSSGMIEDICPACGYREDVKFIDGILWDISKGEVDATERQEKI